MQFYAKYDLCALCIELLLLSKCNSDFICMPRSRQMHHDLCFKSQQPFKRAHVDVQIIREGYLYHAFNQSINNSSFNALLESDKAICEYVMAVSSLGSAVNKVSSSGSFNQQKCLMLENIHCTVVLWYCAVHTNISIQFNIQMPLVFVHH